MRRDQLAAFEAPAVKVIRGYQDDRLRLAERMPTGIDQTFAGSCEADCEPCKSILAKGRQFRLRWQQFGVAEHDIAGLRRADPR